MKDYSFYNRAIETDKANAGKYYAKRAMLYFYDMEYDLALQDLQKAIELGYEGAKDFPYKILIDSKEKGLSDFDKNKNSLSRQITYVNYYLLNHRYSEAFELLGEQLKLHPESCILHNKIKEIIIKTDLHRLKCKIQKNPRYISPYFSRIKQYEKCLSNVKTSEQKRFYRQRINQDFDMLEKLSIKPESICLLRAKYFEELNEIKHSIKFCQKALDIAKAKKDKGFEYITLILLKDLYVKNYNIDKALKIAMIIVETKPKTEIISKAVNGFYHYTGLFNYDFPLELKKYRSYKLIAKNLLEKRKIQEKKKKKLFNRKDSKCPKQQ